MEKIAARWTRMTGVPIEDYLQEIELWLLEHPVKDEAHLKVAAHRACQRMARKALGTPKSRRHHWHKGDDRTDRDRRREAEQGFTDAYETAPDSPEALVAAYELWRLLVMRCVSFRGPAYQAAAFDIVLGQNNVRVSRQIRDHVRYDFRLFLADISANHTPKSRYSR